MRNLTEAERVYLAELVSEDLRIGNTWSRQSDRFDEPLDVDDLLTNLKEN